MTNRRWLTLASFLVVSCTSSESDRQITGLPSAALVEPDLLTAVRVPQLTAEEDAWLQRIRSRKTSAVVHVARIAPGASAQLVAGRAVSLQLTPDLRITAVGNRVQRRATNDVSWAGSLQGTDGRVSIVLSPKGLTGSARCDSTTYTIEPIGGGLHAIARFKDDGRGDGTPARIGSPDSAVGEASDGPTDRGSMLPLQTVNLLGDTRIDVLVVYTDAAADSVPDIYAHIQNAVDEANASYDNSIIAADINRVMTLSVTYDEAGKTYQTQIAELANPSDGVLDEVHALRNLYQADVVVLITGYFSPNAVCGVAKGQWVTSAEAFAVVAFDCAAAPRWTFAHELGHLYGAAHETAEG